MLTGKQVEFARQRAAGLSGTRAALAAGYAKSSARVVACRMQKMPEIQAAIAEARRARAADGPAFESAESYLSAVVAGREPADPVRVGAARALLPFERARQRAPVKGLAPRELDARDAKAAEKEMLDAWAEKAKRVRERLARERSTL